MLLPEPKYFNRMFESILMITTGSMLTRATYLKNQPEVICGAESELLRRWRRLGERSADPRTDLEVWIIFIGSKCL